jgi:hypothetical protein
MFWYSAPDTLAPDLGPPAPPRVGGSRFPRAAGWRWLASLLLLSSAPIFAPSPAGGTTISFSSPFNSELFDSHGNPLDATFTFELGTFINSFVPTAGNIEQWSLNWQAFDSAIFGTGWNPGAQEFLSTADLNADGTSTSARSTPGSIFNEGNLLYLWVFNSKVLTPGSEWALVRNAATPPLFGDTWLAPVPGGIGFHDIRLFDADTPILGGVNDTRGGGDEPTVDPASYLLQTHAVPEPGGALMILAAGMALLLRRMVRSR